MDSGKYGSLSGAIARMGHLDFLTDNLSNVNTVGYKKSEAVFEATLEEAQSGLKNKGTNFTEVSGSEIDFTQGTLKQTGNPMNVAINGEGFFQVQQEDGSRAFSRQGNLQLDPNGTLVNAGGMPVLDTGGNPLVLSSSDITIDRLGGIVTENGLEGQIGVFQFEDTSVLSRQGSGLFVAEDGEDASLYTTPILQQGYLEGSNVNVMQEMGRMVETLRAFEASQKALKVYNDLAGKANDLGLIQ